MVPKNLDSLGRSVFGVTPDSYDKGRLPYPDLVYSYINNLIKIKKGKIFEVGAGTGSASRKILTYDPRCLVVVEPDMRSIDYMMQQKMQNVSSLKPENVGFEEWVPSDKNFDLGVAASSFHWLVQDQGLHKVTSLLRPGGWWVMWWNVFGSSCEEDVLYERVEKIANSVNLSLAHFDADEKFDVYDVATRKQQMEQAGLQNFSSKIIRWRAKLSTHQVLEFYSSLYQIAKAEPKQRSDFLKKLSEAIVEDFGGKIDKKLSTVLYAGQKK